MKKILVITPFLYTDDIHIEATPVVNYFAQSWVRQGFDVRVIHLPSLFPRWMRIVARPFLKKLETKLSATINCDDIKERIYVDEGVKTYRIPMIKLKPHARYSKSVINKTVEKINQFLDNEQFSPDVLLTHWINPGVEILDILKTRFNVVSSLVLHTDGRDFQTIFKDDAKYYRERMDIIGFRSESLKKGYEKLYGTPPKWFICYSGIPDNVIGDEAIIKNFKNRFIFVGNLRKRKNPDAIIKAISKVYSKEDDFTMTYIGEGALEPEIKSIARENNFTDNQVILKGYQPRNMVLEQLKHSDVLIMISSKEVFGLVYLEAMAMGCIPIGSKGEGIDGVIINGKNGFLVTPGDEEELAKVLSHIRQMSENERKEMIKAAFETAQKMTDTAVAAEYINNVFQLGGL